MKVRQGKDIYDLIIIGSGPAGYSAGIYACRSRLKTLLIECFTPPSQVTMADLIENYPGFPEGISGFKLIEALSSQAKKFGLDFFSAKVDNIGQADDIWQVRAGERLIYSLAIILAVGARHKRLGVPGEEEFRGKGVSYCAVCDGPLFKDAHIVVIGGGDSAVGEALFLTRFASKVFLVHRRNRLRAVGLLAERVKQDKKIEPVWDSQVTQIYGKDKVEGVSINNLVNQGQSSIACSAVFISVGYIPNTDFLSDLVKLDSSGYIITDQAMRASQAGIFACGDCRAKLLRQVVTACGDGATAASSAIEYIAQKKGDGSL